MKAQILNPEKATGSRKSCANAFGVVGEDVLTRFGLCHYQRPTFGRVLEPPVIAVLSRRVLGIPDHTRPRSIVVVAPFQAADLRFPPGRGDGEVHDGRHRDLRAPVATLEVLPQPGELIGAGSPRAPLGLADQPQLAAGAPGLLDDLRTHGELPDALAGPQYDANPDQVIDHGRGPGTRRAPRLNMSD